MKTSESGAKRIDVQEASGGALRLGDMAQTI